MYKVALIVIVTTFRIFKADETFTDGMPVVGFNVETIQHKNTRFTAWDIGCREKMV